MNPPDNSETRDVGAQTSVWRFLRREGVLLIAAVCLAYANSFSGVFVMDDQPAILTNPTIRSLSWAAWQPPGEGATVEARPVLNFSLALNYAMSGTDPWSYHATNLAIHALATLFLLGWLRRLLARVGWAHAHEVAFMVALLWGIHPLQTESVTYVVQRTESLMGLFYLGALYCQVRGIDSATASRRWFIASVVLCALGMGTKEVMVSAPVLALLIDRTLFAGSFAGAWRQRRWFYAALFSTWLILLGLQWGHLERGGTIGAESGVTWWEYACCQARGLLHYVRLSIWPSPLVFDYGSEIVSFAQIWLHGVIDLALLGLTFVALWRRSAAGLLGAWFFFILAPTSSVVGGSRQMLAEHRMYLPLAAIVVLAVAGLYRLVGARVARWSCVALAAGLVGVTMDRNSDYRSELALYEDNFRKRPAEAHSVHDYAYALHQRGNIEPAIRLYSAALRLKPDHASALTDFAGLLATLPGRDEESLGYHEAFLRLKPRHSKILNNTAVVLLRMPGREADAIRRLETALQVEPDYPEAHFNLAQALVRSRERAPGALAHYESAVRLKPDYAEAHHGLGAYLAIVMARPDAGVPHLQTALRLKPDWPVAHFHLGHALAAIPGRANDALGQYEAAVRLQPDYAEARNALGMLLAGIPGRQAEAIAHLEAAVQAKPDFANAHTNLGVMLVRFAGRPADALKHFEAALRVDPNSADVHFTLGITLRMLSKPQEAAQHFAAALKIRPDFTAAQEALRSVQR